MNAAEVIQTYASTDEKPEWLLGATTIPSGPEMPWDNGVPLRIGSTRRLPQRLGMDHVQLVFDIATTTPPPDTSEVVMVTNQEVRHRADATQPTAYEDTVVVMPPKRLMRVKIRVRSVTKAEPVIVGPTDL